MKLSVLAPFAMVAAATAHAAPAAPRLVPDRDVTVDYVVTPAGHAAVEVEVAVAAGGRMLHITSAELPTTILVNRDSETADIILPLLRAYAEIRIGKYDPERTILRGANFTRGGARVLDGRPCTEWRAISHDGQASACITPNGLILRGTATSNRKGELGVIEARRVNYGALPQTLFQVPPHFNKSPFRFDAEGQTE